MNNPKPPASQSVPAFVEGSNDTPLSASRMNQIVRAINRLLRLQVTRGDSDKFTVSDANATLQIKTDDGGGGGGAALTGTIYSTDRTGAAKKCQAALGVPVADPGSTFNAATDILIGNPGYKGAWNSSVKYFYGDIVNYNTRAWGCISTSSGGVLNVTPTPGANWVLIQTGGGYRGQYTSTTYYYGDIVYSQYSTPAGLYGCIAANGVSPGNPVAGANWELIQTYTGYRGNYSATTAYRVGDIVNSPTSNPPGVYGSKANQTGTLPVQGGNWDLLCNAEASVSLCVNGTAKTITYNGRAAA